MNVLKFILNTMRLFALIIISIILFSSFTREEGKCEILLKEANEKKNIRVQCHGWHKYAYLFDEAAECFLGENKKQEALSVYAKLNEYINDNSLSHYHSNWRGKYSEMIREIYTKEQVLEEIRKSILSIEVINMSGTSKFDIQFEKEVGNPCSEYTTFKVRFFKNDFIIHPNSINLEEFNEKCYQYLLTDKQENEFQKYLTQIWLSSALIQEIVENY